MRKNWFMVLPLVVGMLWFASCGSSPKNSKSENSKVGTTPTMGVDDSDEVRVDWRGRSAGVKEPPQWVLIAAMGDPDNEISGLPRLDGKKAVLLSYKGADLQGVEMWLNSQAYAQAAQRIRTGVVNTGSGAADGSTEETKNVVDQFITLYSKAILTGFGKEMDYWVKTRSQSKGTEEYIMYAVYAMTKEDLKASINETFNKIDAKTAQEQELKTKLNAQMNSMMESINF